MKRLLIALMLVALPGMAAAMDDPKAMLEAFYAPYLQPEYDFNSHPLYLSQGLQALYDMDAKDANGEVGRIDFDPFIQGQDWDTKQVSVVSVDKLGGTARAKVDFDNFGQELHLTYALVLERDGWKIDDVSWVDGELGVQSLREILTAPFP